MKSIAALQPVITGSDDHREPTAAELDAIERELPLITAEVELLDVRISVLDRPLTETDARRLRRARRKVLAAGRALTNQAATEEMSA
ncbi:DUF6284 family protein [Streptomyces sp. 1222.5]|uniref:DUF6284 family protein n=1 Tax=Streptomyces sp. 1222.5 TaxID=1881026 RepID=UPI003D75A3B8